MNLFERIKQDRMQARRDKDSTHLTMLTTLVGECERVDKNPTDDQVIKVINKIIDGNKDNINRLMPRSDGNSRERIFDLEAENIILGNYVPKMLEDNELEIKIKEIKSEDETRKMGDIMKLLKERYAGQYDGKKASQMIKELLG